MPSVECAFPGSGCRPVPSFIPSFGACELLLTLLKYVQCPWVVTHINYLVEAINYHLLWLDNFKEKKRALSHHS